MEIKIPIYRSRLWRLQHTLFPFQLNTVMKNASDISGLMEAILFSTINGNKRKIKAK